MIINATGSVNVTFQCEVHALPSYYLSWSFTDESEGNEVVVYDSRNRLSTSPNNYVVVPPDVDSSESASGSSESDSSLESDVWQLTIISVEVDDAGTYTCMVFADAGSVSSDALLTVHCK